MKKVTNAKKLLVMILLIGVVLLTTSVYADDAGTNTWGNELSLNSTTTTTSPSPSASPITGNTALSLNGTTTTNVSTNTVNTVNTAVSTYNTTNTTNTTKDLPNTGLGDSLPIIALIVVVAISAAYAYKKVQDYQNL